MVDQGKTGLRHLWKGITYQWNMQKWKATENPFVIYEFYETIDEIIKGKNFTVMQTWNTDESGFPVDPSKCKVITKPGETAYKVTPCPGRENVSVLAAVNADGRVLLLLIIYDGKNLQSTW